MYRVIFSCGVLATILTGIQSESSGFRINSDIDNNHGKRLRATPRDFEYFDDESKFGKRNVLFLMPISEEDASRRKNSEAEETLRSSQKTKRCKTPIRKGRLPPLLGREKSNDANQGIPKSRNVQSFHNNGKSGEGYTGDGRNNLRLVSLKNPKSMLKSGLMSGRGEDTANRDENNSFLKAIGGNLNLRDYELVDSHEKTMGDLRTRENNKCVCYCKERDDSSPEKEAMRDDSLKKPWTRKQKTEKDDTRNILSARKDGYNKKPIYENNPRRQFPSQRLPLLYSDVPRVSQYSPNYPKNKHKSNMENLAYVPLVYQMHPEYTLLPTDSIPRQDPVRINIPFGPTDDRSDSFVGQKAPIARKPLEKFNQPTMEHCSRPSSNGNRGYDAPIESTTMNLVDDVVGIPQGDATSSNTRDFYSEEEDNPEKFAGEDDEDSPMNRNVDTADESGENEIVGNPLRSEEKSSNGKDQTGNLPSAAVAPETLDNKISTEELGTNSEIKPEKSIGEFNEKNLNIPEMTESGTLDYSEIREVTTADFTSRAYANETNQTNETSFDNGGPSSYDDFSATNNEPAAIDSVEGRSSDVDEARRRLASAENMENLTAEVTSDELIATTGSDMTKESSIAEDSREAPRNGKNIILGKSKAYASQETSTDNEVGQTVEYSTEMVMENTDNYGSQESFSSEASSTIIYESSTTNDGVFDSTTDDLESSSLKDNNETGSTRYIPNNNNNMPNIPNTNKNNIPDIPNNIHTESKDNFPPELSSKEINNLPSDEINEEIVGSSMEKLPFCDNTLLQSTIKTVLNNFASDDANAMDADVDEKVVQSTGDDLLPEIVQVPNLKGILSMPRIEDTIVDKVKNLLSKLTGAPEKSLNSDWSRNVIKNNLRHTTAAAASSNSELPPMTVKERQFRNGAWVTHLVTLAPILKESKPKLSNEEKIRETVKNLLRHPAVSPEAARHPVVQNMILQSVRNALKPESTVSDESADESMVRDAFENELQKIEMETNDVTTTRDAIDSETMNVSDAELEGILKIAESVSGKDQNERNEGQLTSPGETTTASDFDEAATDVGISHAMLAEGVTSEYQKAVSEEKIVERLPETSSEEGSVNEKFDEGDPLECTVPSVEKFELKSTEGSSDSFVGKSRESEAAEYAKPSTAEINSYQKAVSLPETKIVERLSETSSEEASIRGKLNEEDSLEATVRSVEKFELKSTERSSDSFLEKSAESETTGHTEPSSTEINTPPTVVTESLIPTNFPEGEEIPKSKTSVENRSPHSETSSTTEFLTVQKDETETLRTKIAATASRDRENFSSAEIEEGITGTTDGFINDWTTPLYSTEIEDSTRNDDTNNRESEDTAEIVGATNKIASEKDLAYLGKISVENNRNYPSDLQSIRNSDLYYVGDGVKLPLEITRLKDGSYALSISRKLCERMSNKDCPCCVPSKGNVVSSGRRNRIKEEETTSTERTLNARKRRNLIKDDLQSFSMPVETFVKKYHLSLNLESAPPRNPERDVFHKSSLENKNSEEDRRTGNRRTEIDAGKPGHRANNLVLDRMKFIKRKQVENEERDRYKRDAEEIVSERAEKAKTVWNWLKEAFLN